MEHREATAKEEWVPLQNHPVFCNSTFLPSPPSRLTFNTNLMAWDGTSLLYLWDPQKHCLHRLCLRWSSLNPSLIEADSSSKMLRPDIQMVFAVHYISINRTGELLLLAGPDCLHVMYPKERIFTEDNVITCRTISVGSRRYFNNSFLRVLQVSWHLYSDTHLGILSSDSVFRLFDLSSDVEKPEQEFYLQPVKRSRCRSAVSMCPLAFSFGSEHLWDRFTVFLVFSDGSIYVLCPVVPFGSVYSWAAIDEIYKDTHTFGLKSSNLKAVNDSSLAIIWLESTFPEFSDQAVEGSNLLALRAHPYAPFDASLLLQGPLQKVCRGEEDEESGGRDVEFDGQAVSFLYNSISKDTVLTIAWSSGLLQIDALADELQPVWKVGSSPRLRVDACGSILGVAMICESNSQELPVLKLSQLDQNVQSSSEVDTVWMSDPPPLLRLGVVDLALPANVLNGCMLSLFADPLIPERIYCLHGGGIDSIVLHFLPFSDQNTRKNCVAKAPSVYPVLSTCHSEACNPSPLLGFVTLADSFGHSWIAGLTSSFVCLVMEMRYLDMLQQPLHVDMDDKSVGNADMAETGALDLISKELLMGPKDVPIPQGSSLRSMTADSIEGRSTLHHYLKLFRENYVEYAHKVYIELKCRGSDLKRIIDDQHVRLRETKHKLDEVEENQSGIEDRLCRAIKVNMMLEDRLQIFRSLPGVKQKPLTRAEHDFKSEIERFTGQELDALHSSIEALNGRLRRYLQTSQGNAVNSQRRTPARRKNNQVPDAQISQLKSSVEKLSLVNNENLKKVKLVESTLMTQESQKKLWKDF